MTIKDLLKNHSQAIIEKLITGVLSETHVEIRFDYFEQDQWASISVNQYEEDKEIGLRLHPNNIYDLIIGYYDDEDEFFEETHTLSETEIESIPNGLKKMMAKVVEDEQGIRVLSELLSIQKK